MVRLLNFTVFILACALVSAPVQAAEDAKESKGMARIHLLVRAGKSEEAASAMRALYPDGPPGGAEALEYFLVIGSSAKGWDEARQGLEKLSRAEPDKLGYRLTLAQVLNMRPATLHKGMEMFAALARQSHGDQRVMDAWRDELSKLDTGAGSIGFYQDYLAIDPGNATVRDALADAQRAEAKRVPWELRHKADDQLAAGHPDEAIATLKHALQLDPKNEWVRFDLARLYHKQGAVRQGRATMEEGLSAAPGDAGMLYASALYFELLDEYKHALELLDKIPPPERSDSMKKLRRKTAVELHTQRAREHARDGRKAEVRSAMEQAEAEAGDDSQAVYLAASAWIDLNDAVHAVELMQLAASKPSAPAAARLYYARILDRAGLDEELATVLQSVAARQDLTDDDKQTLRQLTAALATRAAESERRVGNFAAAHAALATALRQDPDNADLLMADARVYASAHEPKKARDIYQQILRRSPGHAGAQQALAEINGQATP